MAGVGLQLNYESPTSLEVDSARSWVLKPDVSRVPWLLPAAMTPQTPRVSALSRTLTGVFAVCVLSMISCSESVEHSGAARRVAALTCSPPTIDMKLLVISNGKAESDFSAIQQVLAYFGTPYDVLDMSVNTAGITSTMLSDGSCHGYYQGVIFAFGGYIYTLPGMATLTDYEQAFGIRQLNWYMYPNNDFGFNYPYNGTIDAAGTRGAATVVRTSAEQMGPPRVRNRGAKDSSIGLRLHGRWPLRQRVART